jgi:putative Mn2+ efflux pump MntP
MAAKLLALILPLGLDTFAVAAALGALGIVPERRLRLSFLFAAFEAGMPLIGLAVGAPLGRAIGSAADYVAIGLLIVFGLDMFLGGDDDDDERLAHRRSSSRNWGCASDIASASVCAKPLTAWPASR